MKIIKMRYSTEPRDRIYVKGYGFFPFAKNMGKDLSNKYAQKSLDSARKSATDAIETAWKRAIQKTAEASAKELPNAKTEVDLEKATPKKRYISPEERQQIIDELKVI